MKVDPALLPSLEALLRLKSVTAAAREQHVSQSAMSQRLKKLRDTLGDPLLVPAGGGLDLSERARALQTPLRTALEQLEQALLVGQEFVPAQTQRHFRVASVDMGELFVLPHLMARVQEQAPGLQISFRRPGLRTEQNLQDLATGALDLWVGGPQLPAQAGYRTRLVGQEPWGLLCSRQHDLVDAEDPFGVWLRSRHMVVSTGEHGPNPIDLHLREQGLERRIAVRVGHFLAAPHIIARSDLVMLMSGSLAQWAAAQVPGLVALPPPLPLPMLPIRMIWHERSHRDPGHRWMRTLALETTREGFVALEP